MTKFESELPLPMRLLPKGKPVSSPKLVTLSLSLASGGMLVFAVPDLIDAKTFADYVNAAFLAGGGVIVSYATTTLAIAKGAPQAAIGMVGSKLLSLGSMAIVGGGLFSATYAGLTIEKIDELRLRHFTRDVATFVDMRDRRSSEAGRSAPVIDSFVDDLAAKEICEEQTSCISGHGTGGRGPVARALSSKRQRAEAIAKQVRQGAMVEHDALRQINRGLASLDKALNAADLKKSERRAALQAGGTEINQGLNALDEAVPVALIAAYADELRRPVSFPGKRDASDVMSNLLAGYGDSLHTVLSSTDDRDHPRPTFPGATGVSETFGYIGHFLPVAAMVAVVELVFPITLWFYTYFALVAQVLGSEAPLTPARRGRPPASNAKGD